MKRIKKIWNLKLLIFLQKIRNTLNEREDKLLKDIDNIYENSYFNEDIIQKGEKLPKQIKL